MARLFRRILVPHDFSQPATHALRLATDLAAEQGAGMTVLHVIPELVPLSSLGPNEVPMWVPPEELVVRERGSLEQLVKHIVGGRRIRHECRVTLGDPFQEILTAARGSDLIVMATAGRTGLAHLVIGSVAEKVVRHSPVPVLTVRPPSRGGAKAVRPARTRRSPSRSARR